MISKVISAAPIGYEAEIIEVEGDSSKGLPTLQIVGMGNKAIDEAKERVRSAIKNSSLDFPAKKSQSILHQQKSRKTEPLSTCRSPFRF